MIKNLLIIDDDELTLFIINRFMLKHQFVENIISITNGQEAIDYFEKLSAGDGDAPELIIMDINMPIMTGWEFLDEYSQRFQPRFPATRICVLSNSLFIEDAIKAKSYSACISYITKPLTNIKINRLKNHTALKQYFGDAHQTNSGTE
ncbi:response regulator [Telluribacter sp. SYSU D00476]|uniref:response regulator n=1 Tax=Telluribacter sp. SYSU D00476 TaxID=2811430 RepID=UPI001FF44D49|nr:response regulator [Telluribacter sp. SYSU D00476]